jgi:hypothetical protein
MFLEINNMDQSNRQKLWVSHYFFLFLIFGLLILTIKLAKNNIVFAWLFIIAMLVLGIPCLIGGVITYGRYKDIYDFEPASLFGRPSNGKNIRGILSAVIYFGIWASIAGGILLMMLQAGIIEQLGK